MRCALVVFFLVVSWQCASVRSARPGMVKGCMKATTEEDCLDMSGCVWCTDSYHSRSTGCYPESSAAILPSFMTCKKAEESGDATVSSEPVAQCSDYKTRDDCDDDDDCAWCEAKQKGSGVSACYPEFVATWLPKQMFDCDLPEEVTE